MPKEIIVCRCSCGCGRVTRETHPICPLCREGKHPRNPLIPPKSAITTQCWDCDNFMVFDVKAKMFKCPEGCRRFCD